MNVWIDCMACWENDGAISSRRKNSSRGSKLQPNIVGGRHPSIHQSIHPSIIHPSIDPPTNQPSTNTICKRITSRG